MSLASLVEEQDRIITSLIEKLSDQKREIQTLKDEVALLEAQCKHLHQQNLESCNAIEQARCALGDIVATSPALVALQTLYSRT